jgi:hypothetical protein
LRAAVVIEHGLDVVHHEYRPGDASHGRGHRGPGRSDDAVQVLASL